MTYLNHASDIHRCRPPARGLRCVARAGMALLGWLFAAQAFASIGFVQSKSTSQNNSSQTVITANFSTAAQSAGDLNVVAIGWGGSVTINSVVDSKGNSYALAVGPTFVSG